MTSGARATDRERGRSPRRPVRWLGALLGLAVAAGGCGGADLVAPECSPGQRLAIVAQSVPAAKYLPCVELLPAGWRVSSFEVDDDGARLGLRSDRSARPIGVSLSASCQHGGATSISPRADGVRSYLLVDSISPRYAGRFYDVYSGGCVISEFDFDRGPHITLVDELRSAIGLYPRRQLARELEDDLGVRLDP